MKDDIIKLLETVNGIKRIFQKEFDIPSYVDKICDKAIIKTIYEAGFLKGFIAFYANNPNKDLAFISMIAVYDANKGLGSELLLSVFVLLKKKGFKRVGLEVLRSNLKAISFYERHGFSIVEEKLNDFMYMEKKIIDVS